VAAGDERPLPAGHTYTPAVQRGAEPWLPRTARHSPAHGGCLADGPDSGADHSPGRSSDTHTSQRQATFGQCPRVELDREPVSRPLLGCPAEEALIVWELDGSMLRAQHDPRAVGFVLNDGVVVISHEHMFSYIEDE